MAERRSVEIHPNDQEILDRMVAKRSYPKEFLEDYGAARVMKCHASGSYWLGEDMLIMLVIKHSLKSRPGSVSADATVDWLAILPGQTVRVDGGTSDEWVGVYAGLMSPGVIGVRRADSSYVHEVEVRRCEPIDAQLDDVPEDLLTAKQEQSNVADLVDQGGTVWSQVQAGTAVKVMGGRNGNELIDGVFQGLSSRSKGCLAIETSDATLDVDPDDVILDDASQAVA